MDTIRVVIKGEGTFSLKRGENVLSVLSEERRAAISGCAGNGSCGKCAVRFLMGAPLPTATDRKFFPPLALRDGYRLACVAKPMQNCILEFCFEEKEPEIVDVTYFGGSMQSDGGQLDSQVVVSASPEEFGDTMVIVDLGTTTIVMQLIEIKTGKVIDTYKTLNPQRRFGADVISRIDKALRGDSVLLSECVKYCLDGEINKWLYQGFSPELIVIAGNTCMTYLYNEYDVTGLSRAPYYADKLGKIETEIAHIRTIFLPGMSAFVGGDITAGLMACRKYEAQLAKKEKKEKAEKGEKSEKKEKPAAVLFVDLGTNGEIALMNGRQLWATATSAGPAFEGGANANAPGTDMIRIVATLLSRGMVDETGAFTRDEYFQSGVVVDGVLIRQEDIRSIQVAKAAIYTGICVLCEKAGLDIDQIDRVYLAGGFGYYLDVESACAIGLLPAALSDRTKAVGNTALAGAREYALSYRKNPFSDPAATICKRASCINLAEVYEFEKMYIGAMDLVSR